MDDHFPKHAPRSTSFESYSTTFKCIVGSGLLSLGFAFSKAGWLVGGACMLLVGAFSLSTMQAMIDAVHLTRTRLRRRKKAKMAHSASLKSFEALQRAHSDNEQQQQQRGLQQPKPKLPNGRSSDLRGASTSPSPSPSAVSGGASYGSLEEGNGVGVGFRPAASPGPDALDPLDLSIIKADPDADQIGYTQVAFTCYGRVGRIITDVVLIFCQVGSCAAFLILVLGNVQAVLRSLGVHVAVELIAAALVPIIIALALPRSTTFLASAAHFGNFTMLAALGTIGYYGLVSERDSDIGAAVQNEGFAGILGVMRRLPAFPASATDLSIFFGISAFSFAAHCEVVAVEADAPSRDEYVTVLARSMALITSLYILIGVYAFACFNTATQANIMLNLGGGGTEGGGGEGEGSEIFVNIVRVAVSCTLLVNVAMALLPASQTLDLIIIGPAPLSIDHPHQVEPSDSHSNSYGSSNALSERSALLEERSAPTSPNTLMNGGGSGANSRGHSDDHWPAPVVRLNTPALDASELAASEEKAAAARAYHRKGNWLRVGSVLGFVIFALLVQNLSIVFSLVGSIAGGLVCFSLPPLFAWRMACLEKQVQSPARVAFLAVQVLFGIVLIGLGLEVIFVGEA